MIINLDDQKDKFLEIRNLHNLWQQNVLGYPPYFLLLYFLLSPENGKNTISIITSPLLESLLKK